MLIIVKFYHESGDRVGLKQVLQGKEFGSGGFKILFYSNIAWYHVFCIIMYENYKNNGFEIYVIWYC